MSSNNINSGKKIWVIPYTGSELLVSASLKVIKAVRHHSDALFINHVFTISWLAYPWRQCTAEVVKVRDYKVTVHKGLGSDKVLRGVSLVTWGQVEPDILLQRWATFGTGVSPYAYLGSVGSENVHFSEEETCVPCISSSGRPGRKSAAAHERQQFQPLTCCSLSHAGSSLQVWLLWKCTVSFLLCVRLLQKVFLMT